MVSIVFNSPEERKAHNERTRIAMYEHYHKNGGKYKSLIRYYKKKFGDDDDDVKAILENLDFSDEQKLNELKRLNFNRKTKSLDKTTD